MNIADSVNTRNDVVQTVRTTQNAVERNTTATEQIVPESSADQYIPGNTGTVARTESDTQNTDQQTENDQRDAFVPTPVVSHNALYNVADIQKDSSGRIIRTHSMPLSPMRSQQASEKIADIILSLGRKSLSIFRLDT